MKKTTVKLTFTHVWETPRKNYLPSPFAVAAQLLQWTPIPPSWQALVPPGIKTTSLPLVLMQPPQYNQPNSAQQQQKCTRTGYTTSFYFQPCFLPTAVLTWFKGNTFHITKKKSLWNLGDAGVMNWLNLILLGIFILISFSAAFPPFTNCQLWRDTRKLRKCNWYFLAAAYSCERFSQISWVPWQ